MIDTADTLDISVRARIKGNRIECKVCGALLAKKIEPHGFGNITGETGSEFMRNQEPRYVKKVESHPYAFEIKCKSRKNGVYCNAVNTVFL